MKDASRTHLLFVILVLWSVCVIHTSNVSKTIAFYVQGRTALVDIASTGIAGHNGHIVAHPDFVRRKRKKATKKYDRTGVN